jgi:hypothetical protein
MRPIHQSPQAIALLVAAETVADEFRRGHNEDTQSRSFYAFKIFEPMGRRMRLDQPLPSPCARFRPLWQNRATFIRLAMTHHAPVLDQIKISSLNPDFLRFYRVTPPPCTDMIVRSDTRVTERSEVTT